MNVDTIELVTTQRPAPLNGAPSSADYNDSMGEVLTDLASLSDFLNSIVVPMLKTLPEMSEPVLDGAHMFADRVSTSPLFYDSVATKPLTVADVLSRFDQIVRAMTTRVDDLAGRVKNLQTQLATTNQNDVARAIQGFNDTLKAINRRVSILEGTPVLELEG